MEKCVLKKKIRTESRSQLCHFVKWKFLWLMSKPNPLPLHLKENNDLSLIFILYGTLRQRKQTTNPIIKTQVLCKPYKLLQLSSTWPWMWRSDLTTADCSFTVSCCFFLDDSPDVMYHTLVRKQSWLWLAWVQLSSTYSNFPEIKVQHQWMLANQQHQVSQIHRLVKQKDFSPHK